jgi:hypothetical protein
LGFNLNPFQRSITYNIPWDKVIRTTAGAGPIRNATSGLIAKTRLTVARTFPSHACIAQLQDIIALHVMRGPQYIQCVDEVVNLRQKRFPCINRPILLRWVSKRSCRVELFTCPVFHRNLGSLYLNKVSIPQLGAVVCVNCYFLQSLVRKQGAIPLIIGGWPTKRPMMRAVNVPVGSSWV